ncbi:uncharacterized protein LOC126369438 [Pectinophora gossypiella]|uniref:uncharacterized protein LOC126369438 n=1 Tax=Pectinophora gossypiella TaxID=13191 RepID=UPI00214E13AE|nr:uncharacterized protein LOC126369438 [Pectinophora gossypiella]
MAAQNILLMAFLLCGAVKAQNSIPVYYNDVEIPDGCRDLQSKEPKSGDENVENFCTHMPTSYPQKWIDSYVEQWDKIMVPHQQSKAFHGVEETPYVRDAGCDIGDNNCCTESATLMPFYLKSEDQMMLVIQPTFFQQTIKVKRCVSSGSECFKDLDLQSVFKEATCENEMGTTKLLVFNSKTNSTEMRDLHFPVDCSCHIRD